MSLFADGRISLVKNLTEAAKKKKSATITCKKLIKVIKYKIKIQKSIVFLSVGNEQSETEIQNTIQLTIIKYEIVWSTRSVHWKLQNIAKSY